VISRVENRTHESSDLLRFLFPHSGRGRIIGVTGSPGVGKSSLVDCIANFYRRKEAPVAIVAVDPTSPFTGGAILGDRIRMQSGSLDPGVYIRSMATRGNLGGLAAATADVVLVLDAAGKDPILVETVGVGQDEVEIVKLADISIVVLVPGMGDDVQALKAGVMEIADVFVINKSDRPGADKLERALTGMLSLAHRPDGWTPPVVRTVATEGSGIDELALEIDRCLEFFQQDSRRPERRKPAARQRLLSLLEERLMTSVLNSSFQDGELDRIVDDIADRKIDPYSVVEDIIRRNWLKSQSE